MHQPSSISGLKIHSSGTLPPSLALPPAPFPSLPLPLSLSLKNLEAIASASAGWSHLLVSVLFCRPYAWSLTDFTSAASPQEWRGPVLLPGISGAGVQGTSLWVVPTGVSVRSSVSLRSTQVLEREAHCPVSSSAHPTDRASGWDLRCGGVPVSGTHLPHRQDVGGSGNVARRRQPGPAVGASSWLPSAMLLSPSC